jgi:hypothetical protein
MSDNNASSNGMREFIVGTGGANLYPFAAVNPASEVAGTRATVSATGSGV